MSSCRRAFVPSEARAFAPALAPQCGGLFVGLTTSAKPPHIPDMIRIAISQAAFDARSLPALLMILLAGPAYAGSRFGGGFHGGFHGGGHRSGGRARVFFGAYGYGCGYNCG